MTVPRLIIGRVWSVSRVTFTPNIIFCRQLLFGRSKGEQQQIKNWFQSLNKNACEIYLHAKVNYSSIQQHCQGVLIHEHKRHDCYCCLYLWIFNSCNHAHTCSHTTINMLILLHPASSNSSGGLQIYSHNHQYTDPTSPSVIQLFLLPPHLLSQPPIY